MAFGRHIDAYLRSEGSPRDHDNPHHAGMNSHLRGVDAASHQLSVHGFHHEAQKCRSRSRNKTKRSPKAPAI